MTGNHASDQKTALNPAADAWLMPPVIDRALRDDTQKDALTMISATIGSLQKEIDNGGGYTSEKEARNQQMRELQGAIQFL